MIPVSNQLKNVEVVEQPSLCPRMIVESERIIGQCDDVEAIKQAIYNILNTERYQYIIFRGTMVWNLRICSENQSIMLCRR